MYDEWRVDFMILLFGHIQNVWIWEWKLKIWQKISAPKASVFQKWKMLNTFCKNSWNADEAYFNVKLDSDSPNKIIIEN